MNSARDIQRRPSVCPHDCPSVCALDVEVIDGERIGRIRGAPEQTYTSGVICAKVARYSERIHHPDRLTRPLLRTGLKGAGQFIPIDWDEALDRIAERFLAAEHGFGPESVWPYFYAGTMGLVMRDGIERLTHAKRYSRFFATICVGVAWPGYLAGTGRLMGADPREMAKSDCVVIWGTNAVATQVNVMTHAIRARKERGRPPVRAEHRKGELMASETREKLDKRLGGEPAGRATDAAWANHSKRRSRKSLVRERSMNVNQPQHSYEEIRDVVIYIMQNAHATGVNEFGKLSDLTALALYKRDGVAQSRRSFSHGASAQLHPKDSEIVLEIVWDLFRQGIITLGLDAANPGWPWLRLSGFGERALQQSPPRFYDRPGFHEKIAF